MNGGGKQARDYSPRLDERDSKKRVREYPLVRVRYLDHTAFKNIKPKDACPFEREAIGRIYSMNSIAIWLLTDFPIKPIIEVDFDPCTGLVIIRCCILEITWLDQQQSLRFNYDVNSTRKIMNE